MSSLKQKFHRPLPSWIREIREEAEQKIVHAEFSARACLGDRSVMRALILRFWPFVDIFPRLIRKGSARLIRNELLEEFSLIRAFGALRLLLLASHILADIQKDEEDHRKFWLDTAEVLGFTYGELEEEPIREVQAITDALGENTDAFTMFLRFVTVEIVAETVSKNYLAQESFIRVLGKRGTEWFRVHMAPHEGMTHEELAFRLAFAFHRSQPAREEANRVIQHLTDLFVAAGEKCVELSLP